MTAWAPSAMALNTSEPVRTPESKIIVISVEYAEEIVNQYEGDPRKGSLTIPHCLNNFRKHLETPHCAVDLAPCVVSYDDTLASNFKGFACVRCTLNTLD